MADYRETIKEPREVLFFASYCGDDNSACSARRPCPICLGMSNVFRIPAGTAIEYVRELEPNWNVNRHLEKLTARQIGSAKRRRSQPNGERDG